MAAKDGRIDFMFLAPPLTRPLDPLLHVPIELLGGLHSFYNRKSTEKIIGFTKEVGIITLSSDTYNGFLF